MYHMYKKKKKPKKKRKEHVRCAWHKSVMFESLLSLTRLSMHARKGGLSLKEKKNARKRLALSCKLIQPPSLTWLSSHPLSSQIRASGGVERRRRKRDNVIGITIEKRLCISQVSLQGGTARAF